MTSEKFQIFKDRVQVYLDCSAFDVKALKANLETPSNTELLKIFKTELLTAIQSDTLDRHVYEELTGLDFDDDLSYKDYLQVIYNYLFAGGAQP